MGHEPAMELAMLREIVKALEEFDLYVDLSEPWTCPACGPSEPQAALQAQQGLSNALMNYREWKRERR